MPKYAARTDANQGEIVDAIRDIGATVLPMHAVGRGFPDLLVEYRRTLWLFEVKDGAKVKSKQKLTKAEQAFFDKWQTPVVVRSPDEAIMYLTEYASPADVPPF